MTPGAVEALRHAWRFWGRPEQFAPGTSGAAPVIRGGPDLPERLRSGAPLPTEETADWTYWLLLAGRGFGKTRAGAEFAIEKARALPGSHGALVAATADDARKTMLSAGMEHIPEASGILAVSSPDFRPVYEASKRILTWPNGTVATLYSAEEPNRLRGPQHHWTWVDEMAVWQKEQAAWDELLFGLRLGPRPQACITTTPRPIKILRDILRDPQTVVTRGPTYANRENLSPGFILKVVGKYEGTRLGRQELEAEILDDVPGALWQLSRIEELRVRAAPELRRIVVAIDPAVSSTEASDETGIVVAGVGQCSCRGAEELHGFVLEDRSGKYTPNGWAQAAVEGYRRWQADKIVAEKNQGGVLVEVNLRTVYANAPIQLVHAAQGKRTRAEPVAALYEQGRVHHVGEYARLEDQLCLWDPQSSSKSPDRLDALV